MAEQDRSEDETATAAVAAKPAGPAKSRKKLFLIVGAVVAVLGVGGAAYAVIGGKTHDDAAATSGSEGHDASTFVDVPPMVVNLRSADGAPHFIKLHFMLVPGAKASADAVTAKLPLLLDAYQPFLRELRPEDLAGSAAVFRIKEEMLVRAHDTLGDGQIKDVLIQDLIQQ